ncbi:hypothetical protein ABIA38_008433 [Embleya sp. AB8]
MRQLLSGSAWLARGRGGWPVGVVVLGWCVVGPGSVRRGRVVAGGRRLVVARPLRGRGFLGASHPLLPVHYVAVTTLVGFAGSWSGAVVRLASWCWAGAVVGPGAVRRGRVVTVATASSLHVPSGAGVFAWCFASVLPVHYVAVTARDGFAGSWSGAVGRLGVVVWGWWRGGPGSVRRGGVVGGGRRLVVARPLRGRGLCLVLRIRCCPSTTWPSPPGSASPDSWSGAVVRGASGCSAAAQAFWPYWGWVVGVAVCMWAAGLGSWVGSVSGAWFSGAVCGLFCLVVPGFRLGAHETRTRRPARTRVPGETAGRASP